VASASLAPFQSRDYSILWTGSLLSNVGTWMETVALSYYVADTTGRASWAAAVAAAGFLPIAVLAPVGSAMSDRLDRTRVLVAGNAIAGLIAAVLALLVGRGTATPAGIAALTFVAGSVHAFSFPFFQTTLPRLVPREHLVAAVGLSNAGWNLGRVIGPSIAGIAIAVGGVSTALWCNAASFVAVIVGVLIVRLGPSTGEARPVFAALGDGIRFARTNPSMRRMVPFMVLTIGIGSPFIAFVSQMATVELDGGPGATSVLVGAQGIGAVTAAVALGSASARFGLWRVMVSGGAIFGVALVVYGGAPTLWVAALGLGFAGFGYGSAFTSFGGVAQEAAPDEMRGRVLAVNSFVIGTCYPLSTVIQGLLADRIGLRPVTVASGVLLLVALAWRVGLIRQRSGHLGVDRHGNRVDPRREPSGA